MKDLSKFRLINIRDCLIDERNKIVGVICNDESFSLDDLKDHLNDTVAYLDKAICELNTELAAKDSANV